MFAIICKPRQICSESKRLNNGLSTILKVAKKLMYDAKIDKLHNIPLLVRLFFL